MNTYEILKNNLKSLRTANHLTQQELSNHTHIPRANLARYETGENVPPLDILVKLADFFDISIDELVGRDDVK